MSTETSTPRAIAYCRVSTPRQAREGGCLATQARLGCRLTEQAGLQVERVTEEVSSGATLWARALLHRDRTALLDGAAAALIVASADRLARSAVDLAIVQEAAARSNARVLVADEPLPGSGGSCCGGLALPTGRAGSVSSCARMLTGKRGRALAGNVHNAGIDKYGYCCHRQAGRQLVHPAEAAIKRSPIRIKLSRPRLFQA